MSNSNLHKAKIVKNNEFYTQYKDVEDEVEHYKEQLVGKIVYCNCDNPKKSNFWKYFINNFYKLKLKAVFCSFYNKNGPAYAVLYEGINKYTTIKLKGDGDFRSKECLEILNDCDVVITNPPFSLFKDFVDTIMEANKDILIIGSNNAITYKNIFTLLKEDKIRIGYSNPKKFYIGEALV